MTLGRGTLWQREGRLSSNGSLVWGPTSQLSCAWVTPKLLICYLRLVMPGICLSQGEKQKGTWQRMGAAPSLLFLLKVAFSQFQKSLFHFKTNHSLKMSVLVRRRPPRKESKGSMHETAPSGRHIWEQIAWWRVRIPLPPTFMNLLAIAQDRIKG